MDARCRDVWLAAGFKGIFHEDWRTRFHGELPDRWRNRRRGGEIAEWLSRHPEVSVYAIVDDDSDMLPEQRHAFVQTRFEDGIAPDHVAKIVRVLGRDPVLIESSEERRVGKEGVSTCRSRWAGYT